MYGLVRLLGRLHCAAEADRRSRDVIPMDDNTKVPASASTCFAVRCTSRPHPIVKTPASTSAASRPTLGNTPQRVYHGVVLRVSRYYL